jgi:hypothetical protein
MKPYPLGHGDTLPPLALFDTAGWYPLRASPIMLHHFTYKEL